VNSYREEMERLLNLPDEEFPHAVFESWSEPGTNGELFGFCTKERRANVLYGCLTMVKNGFFTAETDELTKMIREDDRIPSSYSGITRENLHVFAEWQEHMDEVLGREPIN